MAVAKTEQERQIEVNEAAAKAEESKTFKLKMYCSCSETKKRE